MIPSILALLAAATLQQKTTYDDEIKPILRQHCFGCHNADKKKADLDLTTYTALRTGSSTGEIVATADLGASKLWKVVARQ